LANVRAKRCKFQNFQPTPARWLSQCWLSTASHTCGFEEFWQTHAVRLRIFNEPHRGKFLPIIEQMAQAAGVDAKQALQDALPLQYVIRAVGSKRS